MGERIRIDFDELFKIWDSQTLSKPNRGVYVSVSVYFARHRIRDKAKFTSTMRRLGDHINRDNGALIKTKWNNPD